MYIVVVPSRALGGVIRVVVDNGTRLSSRYDLTPTGWSDPGEARAVARKLRCGIVVEDQRGRWMMELPSHG